MSLFRFASSSTSRPRRDQRRPHRFRADGLERCEERVVLSTLVEFPNAAGIAAFNNPGGAFFATSLVGPQTPALATDGAVTEYHVTISLTDKFKATFGPDAMVQVGIASYMAFSPFSLAEQVYLDSATAVLRSTDDPSTPAVESDTVTLRVPIDSFYCTQVDAFVGDPVLQFDPDDPRPNKQYEGRIIVGAIIHPDGSSANNNPDTRGCQPDRRGAEGKTLGFWKNKGLRDGLWATAGLSPNQTLGSLFGGDFLDANGYGSLKNATLLQALDFNGGPSVLDKGKLLLKQAVAAALNARVYQYNYSFTQVILATRNALATQDPGTILAQKDQFDAWNNQGVA